MQMTRRPFQTFASNQHVAPGYAELISDNILTFKVNNEAAAQQ